MQETEQRCGAMRAPEAAAYLQISPKTLANWRSLGQGPAYSKLGHAVVYQQADLDDFLNSQRVGTAI
jgi:predicted DNA-binding transcriptional regulator AlpA